VVTGALNTVMSEKLSTQEVHELLLDAAWGAEAMTEIVDNLLELSRWQSNRLALRAEPLDVRPIISRVIERSAKKSAKHQLVADIAEGLPPVVGDPVRVAHILDNLVGNAVKYSPDGGEVVISARKEANDVVISVRDQGIGISPSDLKKLFEPFQRLETAASDSAIIGVGLGLVVCKRLVEAQGGRIWVESGPGKGSTFRFTLPVGKKRPGSNGPAGA
jgi:signal transduction histidine kinase